MFSLQIYTGICKFPGGERYRGGSKFTGKKKQYTDSLCKDPSALHPDLPRFHYVIIDFKNEGLALNRYLDSRVPDIVTCVVTFYINESSVIIKADLKKRTWNMSTSKARVV